MRKVSGYLLALAIVVLAPFPAISAEQSISRAQFTSAVLDREPTDDLTAIDPAAEKIFFFTELRNMDGSSVTHRWTLNGAVMAEVSFKVRASRWRVYSSKTLLPEWRGEWVVDVLDESGTILETRTVGYSQ
jgi:hypothetical protein